MEVNGIKTNEVQKNHVAEQPGLTLRNFIVIFEAHFFCIVFILLVFFE